MQGWADRERTRPPRRAARHRTASGAAALAGASRKRDRLVGETPRAKRRADRPAGTSGGDLRRPSRPSHRLHAIHVPAKSPAGRTRAVHASVLAGGTRAFRRSCARPRGMQGLARWPKSLRRSAQFGCFSRRSALARERIQRDRADARLCGTTGSQLRQLGGRGVDLMQGSWPAPRRRPRPARARPAARRRRARAIRSGPARARRPGCPRDRAGCAPAASRS